MSTPTKSADTTIEQQARMEAEAKYPIKLWPTSPAGTMALSLEMARREAYADALISERSKPHPSVDEVMEVVKQWSVPEDRYPYDCIVINEQEVRDRLTKLFNK